MQSEISDAALDAYYLETYQAAHGHDYFDDDQPDPDDDGWDGWVKESERKVD